MAEKKKIIVIALGVYDEVSGEASLITTEGFDEIPPFLLPDVISDLRADLEEVSEEVSDLIDELREVMKPQEKKND